MQWGIHYGAASLLLVERRHSRNGRFAAATAVRNGLVAVRVRIIAPLFRRVVPVFVPGRIAIRHDGTTGRVVVAHNGFVRGRGGGLCRQR